MLADLVVLFHYIICRVTNPLALLLAGRYASKRCMNILHQAGLRGNIHIFLINLSLLLSCAIWKHFIVPHNRCSLLGVYTVSKHLRRVFIWREKTWLISSSVVILLTQLLLRATVLCNTRHNNSQLFCSLL